MGKYYDMLREDIRFVEGLNACMNCGICTGLCPAAEFYNYDPRRIAALVQSRDDDTIEALLRGEEIWYCGECMSCKPRCPRGNTPGAIIQALRTLSQKLGFFTESEKGRQQLALKRVLVGNILNTGYCIIPKTVDPDLHPEQGPVWRWIYEHDRDMFEKFGENYRKPGTGLLREIDDGHLDEIKRIFDVTGGTEFTENIEKYSREAAAGMGEDADSEEYFKKIYTANNGTHTRE